MTIDKAGDGLHELKVLTRNGASAALHVPAPLPRRQLCTDRRMTALPYCTYVEFLVTALAFTFKM